MTCFLIHVRYRFRRFSWPPVSAVMPAASYVLHKRGRLREVGLQPALCLSCTSVCPEGEGGTSFSNWFTQSGAPSCNSQMCAGCSLWLHLNTDMLSLLVAYRLFLQRVSFRISAICVRFVHCSTLSIMSCIWHIVGAPKIFVEWINGLPCFKKQQNQSEALAPGFIDVFLII